MIDPIRRLLTEAGNAKQTRAFWQAVTGILSDWVGGARVHLVYKGLNESGTVQAGATAKGGERFIADYHDAEGRHVQATFQGLPDGFPSEALRSAVEIATHLAVMVARRAGLERERRLGTFLVELSRWLLAAPERELLLRYTLQRDQPGGRPGRLRGAAQRRRGRLARRGDGGAMRRVRRARDPHRRERHRQSGANWGGAAHRQHPQRAGGTAGPVSLRDGARGDDRSAAHLERRGGRGGRGALHAPRRRGAAAVPARGPAISHGGGRVHRR